MYKPLDIIACPAAFCFYSLLLLSGKTNNVVKDGLKAQQSHSPGQRPGY